MGKGCASVLRGSGVRVSITNCDPICAVQACEESFQAAIESVVSEPELCGSGVDRHVDIVHRSLFVVEHAERNDSWLEQ